MQTLQVKISERDYQRFNFDKYEIKFQDLVDIINKDNAKNALLQANKIARKTGLSDMSMEEINKEI